ncbi:MAG: hypothetical protein JJE46_14535 [Acidimicrobiia bacterium]|nr:hypothetical protein [Acidimicrobiia bacterium]
MSSESAAQRPMTRRERQAIRRRRRRRRQLLVGGAIAAGAAVIFAVLQLGDGNASSAERSSTTTRTTAPTTTTAATLPALERPFSDAVRAENAKPGTAGWRLTKDGAAHDIEGYLNVTSAQRGETVDLFATTVAPTFTIEAYRMGWYQGLGARLVWTSDPVPGKVQAAATLISATNTYEARWDASTSFAIGSDWPDGSYLLKLVASTGQQRWVPLTVRDDASTAPYVIMNAVSSWQAYNRWGGCSLYNCPGGRGDRSKAVSFDRPYDIVTDGSGDFIGNELPLIMRSEEAALDATYITSIDLHQRPELMRQHQAIISLGHDEYWSKTMFDGAEAARDGGVNLVFLGANAVFRQVRFEPTVLGADRTMINYRSTADPIRRVDPSQTTVSFRDSPVNRPEASLIGEQYQCNPVRADMIISQAASWIWANTGLNNGDHLEIGVGSEYDQYIRGQGGPDNVEIVAHSPVNCRGRAGYSDVTYYTAPSGAGVFATGTNYWVSKLMPKDFPETAYNPKVVQATINVLTEFGKAPAGQAHPSVPNWQDLPGTGS